MPRRPVSIAVLVAVIVAAVAAATSGQPAAAQGPIVTGGGASFPSLLINQWRSDVAKPPYNLSINYNAAGSGFGRDKYTSGALDFGQSDIPFLDEELPRVKSSGRGSFVYVPVAAGALAFTYNVVGGNGQKLSNIKLNADTACRLFTDPTIKWNDPAIAADNPGVPLPARQVRPVVRSDRSGTSYVLSEFCIARAPAVWNAFKSFINKGSYGQDQYLAAGRPISQWPSGYGGASQAFSSDGIINSVLANPDTVTYIETGYPKQKRLPVALVKNPAGVFVPPDPPNSTVALGYATGNGDGTFKLRYDGPDPRAYFPSTYSYTIAQTGGFDPAKGKVLATYLNYAVTAGQKRAEPLSFSRLSTQLVNIALDQIVKIPGAPPRPTDLAGAPPPPQLTTGTAPKASGAAVAGAGAPATGTGSGGAAAATGAATDPAAAAAAAGAATDQAAATDAAAVDENGNPVGAGAATQNAAATAAGGPGGPSNSDVFFTLLLGGLIAAAAMGLSNSAKRPRTGAGP